MSLSTTRANKIATVIIPVVDQDAAVDFYVNKLRLREAGRRPLLVTAIEVGLGHEATTIALAPPPHGGAFGTRQTGINSSRWGSTWTSRSAALATRSLPCSGGATPKATLSSSFSNCRPKTLRQPRTCSATVFTFSS